jgi:hypothetical protein
MYIMTCLFSVLFKDAKPTENEESVHAQVAEVLKKAKDIEEKLRCYQGAGEPIRQVKIVTSSVSFHVFR